MPGRGNLIVYGTIQVSSEVATLQDVKGVLDLILKEHGYPRPVKKEEEKSEVEVWEHKVLEEGGFDGGAQGDKQE